ncbi:MAG: MOSC domain-containing protein [Psychrobacter sp.]|nr:MOSC domain-containing protein [Psychrobacter sp.]
MIASLSSIHCYPVKSLGGNCIDRAQIGFEGMTHDRRWLITDPDGRFITARRYPQMLLWQATMDANHNLTLTAPNGDSQSISALNCGQPCQVSVWKDEFIAYTAPDAINQWLSSRLDTLCQLHYLGETSQRPLLNQATKLTFADSAPYLLTTQSSLGELNRHLTDCVSMTHFRPNLVIEGDFAPWIEESWREIRIGEVDFEFFKLCTRCVMINMNPNTGQKSPTHEPYKTLQRLRKEHPTLSHETVFGIHLIAKNSGMVQQGDRVEVII